MRIIRPSEAYVRVPHQNLLAEERRAGFHKKLFKLLEVVYEQLESLGPSRKGSFIFVRLCNWSKARMFGAPIGFNLCIKNLFDGLNCIRIGHVTFLVFCSPMLL